MKSHKSNDTNKLNFTYNDAEIAARIRDLRVKESYTQEALATRLGLDRSYIGHVECGNRSCSKDVLANLAILFDVFFDYLVFGQTAVS